MYIYSNCLSSYCMYCEEAEHYINGEIYKRNGIKEHPDIYSTPFYFITDKSLFTIFLEDNSFLIPYFLLLLFGPGDLVQKQSRSSERHGMCKTWSIVDTAQQQTNIYDHPHTN